MSEFVEASAGTGKTRYLMLTVLRRLLRGDLRMAEFLAITFTEKAANEMRNRLVESLLASLRDEKVADFDDRAPGEFAQAEGLSLGDLRIHARRALAEIDRGFIGTIHSFCARLLKEFPKEAGIAAGATADEGDYFQERFDAAWSRWISEQLRLPAKEWIGLLRRTSLSDLRDLAWTLCDFEVPDEVLADPEGARSAARKAGIAMLSSARDQLRGILDCHGADLTETPRRHAEFYAGILDLAARDALDAAGRRRLVTESEVRTISRENLRKLPEPAAEKLLRLVALARSLKHLDDRLVGDALRLLVPFAREFRSDYLTRGRVTFGAMISLALRLVRDRNVRSRLKDRYKLILVDEFQDTDPAQYEIVLALAEEKNAFQHDWRTMPLERGKLIVVGDPKQSIYSFRGADIEAYFRVGERIRSQGTGRELRENYRSCDNLLRAFNAFFSRLLQRLPSQLQAPHVPLSCGKKELCRGEKACVELVRIEGSSPAGDPQEGAANLTLEEAVRIEASYLADRLAKMRDAGHALGGIAILLRKLTRAHHYLEALREAGIEYVVEGDKYFYHTAEVIELYNLLRCVADPLDRIALFGVLRSPLVGMTDREIYRLRERGELSYEAPAEDPRLERVFELLRELHRTALTRPVHELIHEIFQRTTLLPSCYGGYRREIAVANLLKVQQQAMDLSRRRGMTIQGYLAEFRRRMKEEDEGEDPVADEKIEAVRIMSIHKAKGLQFDTVFLPGLSERTRNRSGRTYVSHWIQGWHGFSCGDAFDLGMLALQEREERIREAEAARLLYVAMTRARHKLILSMPDRKRGGGGESLGDLVDRALQTFSPAEQQLVEVSVFRGKVSAAGRATEEPPPRDSVNLVETWRRIEEQAERARRARVVHASEVRGDTAETAVGRAVSPELAAWIGVVCHAVLARLSPREGWESLLDRELQPVPEALRTQVRSRAAEILARFVESETYRDLCRKKLIGREVPFALLDGDQIITGRMDAVFEDEDGLLIVDYKTESGATLERHAPQMEIYRRAAMAAFPGHRIRTLLLPI